MSPTLPAAYDSRTTDHEQIKDWIDEHDGIPVAIQDAADDRLDVEFGDVDEAVVMPLGWPEFFERFERQDRLFAFQDDPDSIDDAYAFFDRTRIEQSNRLGSDEQDASAQGPLDDDSPDDPGADPDHVGDGRSEVRHEEATDQENADNHRDEPPFNS